MSIAMRAGHASIRQVPGGEELLRKQRERVSLPDVPELAAWALT